MFEKRGQANAVIGKMRLFSNDNHTIFLRCVTFHQLLAKVWSAAVNLRQLSNVHEGYSNHSKAYNDDSLAAWSFVNGWHDHCDRKYKM